MAAIKRKLVLENGMEFFGTGFGDTTRTTVNELVFNTAMVGYQEVVSDPSYTFQMVCMTYPLIGNYGITDEDFETKTPTIGGLIVRQYNDNPSNFRYTKTLSEILEEHRIPAIEGIDTRALTRIIRDQGSQKVLICDADLAHDAAMKLLAETDIDRAAVPLVSCKKRWYKRCQNHRFNVAAIDCGMKHNIIRSLNARGCNVTVLPYNTTAEQIAAIHPDGVFLSNGPGDPADLPEVVELVRQIRGKYPLFGICLGHQMISLAYGASTYKMKFGHRGANHPVKNLLTGKVEITSQNHSYAVRDDSLAGTGLEITHINLLDGTVEGVRDAKNRLFSVQYHPESAPGPQDSGYLFDEFITMMQGE